MVFRRYNGELGAVLRYIVHQLYAKETTEIIIIQELMLQMAGIGPLPSLTDAQIQAMAGGPVLQIEAVASATRGARLDPAEAIWKSPIRLGKALMDSGLALPLLIQLTQQRQSCVFTHDAPLKALAALYDEVGITFILLSISSFP
jgi:THO complex subunit 2